jgi:hypothetical protein
MWRRKSPGIPEYSVPGRKKLFKDSLTQHVRMSQDVPLDDADEQGVVLGEK